MDIDSRKVANTVTDICELKSDLALEHDVILNCMVGNKDDFYNDRECLYLNVKKEGIRLA